jgi:hypothetical protein
MMIDANTPQREPVLAIRPIEVQALLAYLARQPYGEVVQFINLLMTLKEPPVLPIPAVPCALPKVKE